MHIAYPIASLCAASIVALFDFVWCFREERHHIWRTPFTCIKATYVFARYFALLIHLTNTCLFFYFNLPYSVVLCQKWYLFQHLSTVAVEIPFDVVVGLRVFALYQYSIKIGVLALASVITNTTAALIAGITVYRQAHFDTFCSTKGGKFSFVVPVLFQSFQGVMWGLTWYKQLSIKRKLHPNLYLAIPFLPTAFRDGSIVLAILTLSLALAIPYSAFVRVETHMMYPWGATLMSVFCCHLILNILVKATTDANAESVELDDVNAIATPEAPVGTKQSDVASKPKGCPEQQRVSVPPSTKPRFDGIP